jgi:hypothetical protein
MLSIASAVIEASHRGRPADKRVTPPGMSARRITARARRRMSDAGLPYSSGVPALTPRLQGRTFEQKGEQGLV